MRSVIYLSLCDQSVEMIRRWMAGGRMGRRRSRVDNWLDTVSEGITFGGATGQRPAGPDHTTGGGGSACMREE